MRKTRPDLIKSIAEQNAMSEEEAERALDAVTSTILSEVREGNSLVVQNFGKFERRTRSARDGRNPVTGARIRLPESVYLGFTMSRNISIDPE